MWKSLEVSVKDQPPDWAYLESARSALVSETPEQVLCVAETWARDFGWKVTPAEPALLRFHLPISSLWANSDASVTAHVDNACTTVRFSLRMDKWFGQADVDRAVEALANDVLFELQRRGATIDPPALALDRKKWGLARALERIRRPLWLTLLALLAPVLVGVWFATSNLALVFAAAAWFLVLALLGRLSRLFILGMHVAFVVLLVVSPLIVVAILFTVF